MHVISFSMLRKMTGWLAVAGLVLLAGGCGEPQKLPPDQVIQKAVPAIQAATSFHFTLETAKPPKAMPGLYLSGADGDVAKPGKLVGDVTALYSGVPIKVKVIVDGSNQFMTDPASGKWTRMSAAFDVVKFFDPSRGVSDIMANVKGLTDDGTEKIGDTDTYRLKGTVPTSALKALSPEVTAQGDLATTLWIGSSDFLLRKVQLQGPIMTGEPSDVSKTITLSDYNKQVTVETPAVK